MRRNAKRITAALACVAMLLTLAPTGIAADSDPRGEFDINLTCIDWGEPVTSVTVRLYEALPDDVTEDEAKAAFAVAVTYTQADYDWETGEVSYEDVTAERAIQDAEISGGGTAVTLDFGIDYDDATSTSDFTAYSVSLTTDLGDMEAGDTFIDSENRYSTADMFGRYSSEVTGAALDYRLFVPDGVGDDDEIPLIVWLHGGGEFGTDNNAQLTANFVTNWASDDVQEIFGGKAYVLAPQSRSGAHNPNEIMDVVEYVIANNPGVDMSRIYIGGCSMGGMGTYDTILAYPDFFAAAFPICPAKTLTEEEAATVAHMPIYITSSVDDPVIYIEAVIESYDALMAVGAEDTHITLFEDVTYDGIEYFGHFSWVYVHRNFPDTQSAEKMLEAGQTYTSPSGTEISGGISQSPSDLGYETFMDWLADQQLASEAETHTVTFNTNGGSSVPSQTVEAGGTVSRPADPTRDGYTFNGWFTDAACTQPYSFGAAVTGSFTLYAGWTAAPVEAETYTVTFDSQGGSAVEAVIVEKGGTITAPAEPTRTGYTFTGWYKDTACTEAWNFATDTVTGDITLYAGWEVESGKTVTEDTWDDGTVVTTIEDEETGDKTVIVQQPDSTETVVDIPAEGEITAEIKLGEGVDETVVVIPLDDVNGGTVAIIVHEDGTEEIVKLSVADDGKLYIPVDGDVTVKIIQNGKSFDDEDDAVWAKDAIAFVTARELFLGTSDTEFAPNLAMSRGMLATVLYRLEGEPEVGENPFEDVEAGEYYEDPITWAEANGVVKGTGGNFFSPKNDITREELAVMLHRYAGEPEAEADMSHFPDADDISDWAEEAMTWALAEGIITGKDGNMAEPGSNATRAEVATMLQRYVMAIR